MSAAGVAVADLVDLGCALATPGEALPSLFAIAGVGVAHRADAASDQRLAVGDERERVDAALVTVRLDDAPAREPRRREAGEQLTRRHLPDADLPHEVAGGDVSAVRAEGDGLHRRDVRQRADERPGA